MHKRKRVLAVGAAMGVVFCVLADNLPVPEAYPGDPETIADAARVVLPSRTEISLNGLWRSRPIIDGEPETEIPSDDWGWAKIPGYLSRAGAGDHAEDQETFFAPRFADDVKSSKAFAAQVNERRWYRRTFMMPVEAKGHRVLLKFAHVFTHCTVFADGAEVGVVTWPNGEIDLTDVAKPGREQTIALRLICYLPDYMVKTGDAFMGVGLTFKGAVKAKRFDYARGLTGDVTLALVPKGPRATFAWGELADLKNVRFVTETEGLDAKRRYTVKVRVTPLEGCQGTARAFTGKNLTPDAKGRLSFVSPWPDVALWDFDAAHNRYRVETEVFAADGSRIDEVPAYETGFREVRLAGRDVLMNGRPLHLTTLLYWNSSGTAAHVCRKAARAFARHAKGLGYNSFNCNSGYTPASTPNYDEMMEAADIEGMFMMCASVPRVSDAPMDRDRLYKDPEMQRIFRERAESAIRDVRRHPSVILYKLNMNMTGYGSDLDPIAVGDCKIPDDQNQRETRKSAEWSAVAINEIDPTRPAYNHDSGLLGNFYTANIYLGWAPPQERADWMEEWFKRGTKPVNWVEFGTPDESRFQSFRRPYFIYYTPTYCSVWADEYAAEYFGESAMLGDTATAFSHAREDAHFRGAPKVYQRGGAKGAVLAKRATMARVMGLFWGETQKGFRGWGLHGVLPWCQGEMIDVRPLPGKRALKDRFVDLKRPGLRPDYENESFSGGMYNYWCFSGMGDDAAKPPYTLTPYGEAQRKWSRPAVGFLGDGDVFTAARRNYAEYSVVSQRLVLVNDHSYPVTASWRWAVRSGGVRVADGKGTATVAPGRRTDVPFTFGTKGAGTYEIAAETSFSDGSQTRDRRKVRAVAAVPGPRGEIALYDPKGLTRATFDRLGVACRSVTAEALAATPGVVAVGRETLTRELWERTLLPLVEKGRAVVVFEQSQSTLESLGFRVQNRGMRQGFVRFRDAPRLGILDDEALANWAGESTLVSANLNGPMKDRLNRNTQNWAGFAQTRVWRANNRGCIATVIPEKPAVGDWRPLVDGLFALEYAPLLEFRTGRGTLLLCQLDVTARTVPDPYADALVKTLLAKAWSDLRLDELRGVPEFLGNEAFRAGFAYGVKCWANGRDYVVSSGAPMPDDLHRRIADGAQVLALGLTKDEIAAWSPRPLSVVDTNDCCFTRIERPDAVILNGLSNADFNWHGRLSFAAFADADPSGNAALKIVRHGKGAIVFWQLPPWKFNVDDSPHQRISRRAAARMLARLMCNLGWTTFTNGTGYHKFPMYKDVPEASDDPYEWCNL